MFFFVLLGGPVKVFFFLGLRRPVDFLFFLFGGAMHLFFVFVLRGSMHFLFFGFAMLAFALDRRLFLLEKTILLRVTEEAMFLAVLPFEELALVAGDDAPALPALW